MFKAKFSKVFTEQSLFKSDILSSVARFLCEHSVSESMRSVAFVSEKFELGQGRLVMSEKSWASRVIGDSRP